MTQLGAWLEDLRADRISLVALITCLNDRGSIDADRHAAEIQELEKLHSAGSVDQKLYRAIKSKLLEIQQAEGKANPAPPPARPASDDATLLVTPASAPGKDPPEEEDFEATRLMAAPPPNNPPPLDGPAPHESTVIMSAPIKPRSPSITGDHSRPTNTSGPHTSSASRSSLSSWKTLTEATAPIQSIGPGFMIKERFIIERKIGEGGMGVVFLALDERKVEARDRNPRVAVKILNDEFRQHPDALIALQRESRRSQQLAHDNIVRVYDFDKDGAMVYMTMEYVDGQDLKKLIRSVKNKGLPFAQAFPIIEGIASALYRAHSEGIVHSDFKPGNVMLTKDNTPKVFDFGIARAGKKRADGSMEQTVFDAGSLGALTPAYASLEMLQGADIEAPDDIYALGCVAYEILAGFHPFKKVNAEEAEKKGLVPQRIEGLTRKQWQTLKACIAFRRKDRLASALELIQGLKPKSVVERALPIVGIAASVIALVGGGYWLVSNISYGNKISDIESCIESGRCADPLALKAKLDALKADDRIHLSDKHREQISASFREQVEKYWSPANKKFDFSQATSVVKTAFDLYGDDSAWVTQMQSDLSADRNLQLSRLNDQLGERIDPFFSAKAASTSTDAGPMLETLDAIRMIDPVNPIFKDGWIIAAFEQAIHASLMADYLTPDERLARAEDHLATARAYLEDESLIESIQSEIDKEKQRYSEMSEGERAHAEHRASKAKLLDRLASLTVDAEDENLSLVDIGKTWKAILESNAALADRVRYQETATELSELLVVVSGERVKSGETGEAIKAIGIAFEQMPEDKQLALQFRELAASALNDIEPEGGAGQRDALLDNLIEHPVANSAWLESLKQAMQMEPSPGPEIASAVSNVIQSSVADHWPKLVSPKKIESLVAEAQKFVDLNTADLNPAQKTLAEHRASLKTLVSEPSFEHRWQQDVDAALLALRLDSDAATQNLKEQLGIRYSERAESLTQSQQLAAARRAALDGISRVGTTSQLSAALRSIDTAMKTQAVERKTRQDKFKIEAIERTVSLKAMAGDIKSAIASLRRLRRLDRDNAYAAGKAREEIAAGALSAAKREAEKSRYESAIAKLDLAIDLTSDVSLKEAKKQYMSEDCKFSLQAELERPGLIGTRKRTDCVKHLKLHQPEIYPQFEELGYHPVPSEGLFV